MNDAVLEVDHLTKTFRIHRERANSLKQRIAAKGRNRFDEFVALENVTFNVSEGEVFGVIGHNGSGKSTLLKCMAGILQPNEGSVRVHRRMSALLELGAGFHPELTGRENVDLARRSLAGPDGTSPRGLTRSSTSPGWRPSSTNRSRRIHRGCTCDWLSR